MAVDARLWIPAIVRFGQLFSLASLVPVISLMRMGRHTPMPAANAQPGRGKKEPAVPLGVVSAALLLLSELLGCHDLFKASAKGTGRFNVLVKTISKASEDVSAPARGGKQKSNSMGSVFLDTASRVVNGVMSVEENSGAIHGIVMCIALAMILGLVSHAVLKKSSRRRLMHIPGALLPLALFCRSQAELAGKAWKGLVAEGLVAALRLPLRSAALVAATPGEVDEEGSEVSGTPALFAVLQVVSLAASISEDVASGRVGGTIAQFRANPWEPAALFDSAGLATVLPSVLSIVWISWVHLRNRPLMLSLAAILATTVSPLVLIAWWPKVAVLTGVAKPSPEGLVGVLSLVYSGEILAVFLSGGTMCLLGAMGMLHLLSAVHGLDVMGMQ